MLEERSQGLDHSASNGDQGSPAQANEAAGSVTPARVRFGAFEADLVQQQLFREGRPVRLQEKPFQVLATLLERAGEVVTREEIRTRVWPNNEYLDFDANLNTALNKLRRALGDGPDQPFYIRTIPRRGYSFIAPVTVVFDVAPSQPQQGLLATPASVSGAGAPQDVGAGKLRSKPWVAALMGASLLALSAIAAWFLLPHPTAASQAEGHRALLLVLPMESHGGDPQGTDFADGLTDGLITRLSQMNPSQLGVIAKTTALQYRNAHKTVSEIGRELKVDYVLEGTVRREGKRVRVAVRLVRAYDQTPLWAETKEWERADEVDVEGDLSSHVAAGLAEKVFAASPGGAADAHPVRAADSGEQGRTPAVRNAP